MARSLSRIQALLLGLVVVLGLGLATMGLFAIASRGWYGANSLSVKVRFDDIRGVEVGTRVRIQGMDAGEVTALQTPTELGDPVLVCLNIKSDLRHLVRASSRVQIMSEGMLGGKVLAIMAGNKLSQREEDPPAADGAILTSLATTELNDLVAQASKSLQTLQSGPGSLARLANDSTAHDSLVSTLQQFKETAASIQQVSDSMQRLPLVGGYMENPVALLERPDCNRERKIIAEADLFETGSAILTTGGKERLDTLASWLNSMKNPGSEIVVAAYADPTLGMAAPSALVLTRKQSQAVIDYLKAKHAVQKMGWFSSRKVTALGLGTQPTPTQEKEALPAARVDVHVFVPVRQ